MFFIFASLAVGLASGVHAYGIAIVGTLCFILALFVLQKSPFAAGPQFDGLLRFNLQRSELEQREVEDRLSRLCRYFALATIREMAQGERLDYSYQIRLKPEVSSADLVETLGQVTSVRGLNFMNQESVIEV